MATIKEVAKMAGVSISTVSRTLSNRVFVNEDTRKKVMRAVKHLSYKPNFMAKGLKEGRSNTLAIVLPDIINPFYPGLVKRVERQAAEKGYSMILYDCGEDVELEKRYVDALKSHYVDGVIFISTSEDPALVRELLAAGIPTVVMNREYDSAVGVTCVTNDNFQGARKVINYLISQGHRRIACLASPVKFARYRQRYDGCVSAFHENHIHHCDNYMVHNITTIEEAYDATKKLLALPQPPTAIFTFIDMLAIGIYGGIHDRGLSIPDDISVAGFDNINLSQHLIPPLTTYEHPLDRLAKIAIANLLGQIENSELPEPGNVEISGTLILRDSVKDIKK